MLLICLSVWAAWILARYLEWPAVFQYWGFTMLNVDFFLLLEVYFFPEPQVCLLMTKMWHSEYFLATVSLYWSRTQCSLWIFLFQGGHITNYPLIMISLVRWLHDISSKGQKELLLTFVMPEGRLSAPFIIRKKSVSTKEDALKNWVLYQHWIPLHVKTKWSQEIV